MREGLAGVQLHVYDVAEGDSGGAKVIRILNAFTRSALGVGGVFHAAVEVYGEEWSFGFCPSGTGVYSCPPRSNPAYTYRESVPLGATALSKREVLRTLEDLKLEWQGSDYHLLRRNCCHFTEHLADVLGCGPLPAWVNRFASSADSLADSYSKTHDSFVNLLHSFSTSVAPAHLNNPSQHNTSHPPQHPRS
jgi:hypothetical protein